MPKKVPKQAKAKRDGVNKNKKIKKKRLLFPD